MRKYSHNLYLKVFSTYQTTAIVVRKHLIYHKVLKSREVFQTGYTSTHEQILRSTDTRMFGKSQCERVKKLFDL